MKTRTKTLVIATILLAVAAGIVTAAALAPVRGAVQSAQAKPAPSSSDLSYQGVDGQTALELLVVKAAAQIKGTGANAYVTAINGRIADESKKEYWALYINDKLADVGAGSYVTKSGDQIRWHIETY